MPAIEQTDPLLTFEESVDYLSSTDRWLCRAVAERRIRHTKLGKLLRFRKSWLDDYLRENERTPVRVVRVKAKPEPVPMPQPHRRRRTEAVV